MIHSCWGVLKKKGPKAPWHHPITSKLTYIILKPQLQLSKTVDPSFLGSIKKKKGPKAPLHHLITSKRTDIILKPKLQFPKTNDPFLVGSIKKISGRRPLGTILSQASLPIQCLHILNSGKRCSTNGYQKGVAFTYENELRGQC
jgi:hypothetical protein